MIDETDRAREKIAAFMPDVYRKYIMTRLAGDFAVSLVSEIVSDDSDFQVGDTVIHAEYGVASIAGIDSSYSKYQSMWIPNRIKLDFSSSDNRDDIARSIGSDLFFFECHIGMISKANGGDVTQ